MKAKIVRNINNFTAKSGRVGTLTLIEVEGVEGQKTLWNNNANWKPKSLDIEVQEQDNNPGSYQLVESVETEGEYIARMVSYGVKFSATLSF
jgi:hypothetical protein